MSSTEAEQQAETAHSSIEVKPEDEDIVYAGHLKFGIIFAALCLSVFQVSLVSYLL